MFDLREKHRCDPNSCRSSALLDLRREKLRHLNFGGREVVSKSMSLMDITGLAINPARPNHMALGCNDPIVRIYDRRMLTPGGNASEQVKPIHKFLPSVVIENNRGPLGNVFVNDLRFNHDGSQLLASYNGHGIFILDSGSLAKMSMMKDTVKQQSAKKKRKASELSSSKSQQPQTGDSMDVDAPNETESNKGKHADVDESSAASTESPRPKKKRKVDSEASLVPTPEANSEPEPILPPLRPRGPPISTPLPAASQLFDNSQHRPPPAATAGSNRLDSDMFLPANLFSMLSDPRATHTAFPLDELMQAPTGPQTALNTPAVLQQALQRIFSSFADVVNAQQTQHHPPAATQSPPQAPPPVHQSPFSADMIRELTRAIMMESMNAPLATGLDDDQTPAPQSVPSASASSSSRSNAPTSQPQSKSYSDCDGAFLQHLQGHLHFERDLKDCVFMGPKSEFVVSGSEDGNLFIWSSTNGALAALITRGGTTDNIRIVAAPNRMIRLVSIGHSTMLNVWGPTRSEKFAAYSPNPAESPASISGKTATSHEVTEICSKNIAHMRDNAEHRRGRPRVNVDVIRLEEPLNGHQEDTNATPGPIVPPSQASQPTQPGGGDTGAESAGFPPPCTIQ
jgi:hypothetical protein